MGVGLLGVGLLGVGLPGVGLRSSRSNGRRSSGRRSSRRRSSGPEPFSTVPVPVWRCPVPPCLALSCPHLPGHVRSCLLSHGLLSLTLPYPAWTCATLHFPFRSCPVLLTNPGPARPYPAPSGTGRPFMTPFGPVTSQPGTARLCPARPRPVQSCQALSDLARPV